MLHYIGSIYLQSGLGKVSPHWRATRSGAARDKRTMLNQFPRHTTAHLTLSLSLPVYPFLMTHIASIFGGAAAHGELLKFLYRRWNVLRSVHRMGDRLALNAIKLIPSKCHQITQKLLTSLIFIYVYPSPIFFITFYIDEVTRRGLTNCSVQHLLHLKYENGIRRLS